MPTEWITPFEHTRGEIAARCDKEAASILAINLAQDIINDERTLQDAREFYAQTIKAVKAGEQPEYVQGFTFESPQQDITNPGEPVLR